LSLEQPPSESEHLALLLRVSSILSSTQSLEDVLNSLIVEVIETLRAERGFVVLRKDGDWHPVAVHYVNPKHRLEATMFSRTVVTKVIETGRPLITLDALMDLRFMAPPSVTLQGIRSILCAPIRWSGEARGVVYVDHSLKAGAFTKAQLDLLVAITHQASRALETAALHEQLQRVHQESMQHLQGESPGDADALARWESHASRRTIDFALGCMGDREAARRLQAAAPGRPVQDKILRVQLFGPIRVWRDGVELEAWRSRKDRDVLAYLAAHRRQVVNEETLMDLFWEGGGKKALHSLHNSITQIRKTIGDSRRQLLRRKLDGYSLSQDCWVDVEAFSSSFAEGRALARRGLWEEALFHLHGAESLAAGELLQGSYQEWAEGLRVALSEQLSECRSLLAEHFSQRGKHLLAVELWKRVLAQDNCNEAAYRGLLESYRALGRQAEAVRVYQACVKSFEEELELSPPADLEQLTQF
jgi:DNA-binding SARP family transcriptional activator